MPARRAETTENGNSLAAQIFFYQDLSAIIEYPILIFSAALG
jgi:hypothetical protein